MNKTFNFIKLVYKRFLRDDIPALGAQITYYLVLSFFPFLIFLLTLLSYTPFTGRDILATLSQILPENTYNLLEEVITQAIYTKNTTILSFSMITTIWAASNGSTAFIKGINKAYDQKERLNFWKIRITAVIFTLALALVLIFTFFMLVLGEVLWKSFFNHFNLPYALKNLWTIFRYIVPFLTMFLVFTAAYLYIPRVPHGKITFREAVPGALFSTFSLFLISSLFSCYVNNFSLYANTYGSITGVIILLIWLYWGSIIIMLGSEINAVIGYNKKNKI